jgi:DNA-binding transcriptional LysR family regulator
MPNRPDVSADDLRALLAVARAGRMVSAAALLGVDHTTVRRRIDRLEAALGVRLLDRGADGWELTAIGRDVAKRSAPLEEVVEAAVEAAAGGEHGLRGTVRVVAPEGFAVTFAAPALARLRVESPELLVELVTSTRPLSLRGAGFDLAVTIGSAAGSRMSSEPLSEYAVRLYASRAYLAAHPPIRTPADLDTHALVYYVDALLTVRELDLAPLLGGMRVGFGSTSAVAQLEATRRGAGIGLLHAFVAEREPELVPVLPSEVDFRLQFALSVRPESRGLAAVAAARQALIDEVRARREELVPSAKTHTKGA